MRQDKAFLAAATLVLVAVVGSNAGEGKGTDLVTCILDGGQWQGAVRQGDVLLPRLTAGMVRAAEVYAIYVQKIDEEKIKLNVSTTDDPGRPAGYWLPFGEMRGIGKDAKLGVEALKTSAKGTVELTLTLNAEATPMKLMEAGPFEEKPDTIYYIFNSNGFVTKVHEGEIVFGFELEGLFDAAGVRTIKIKKAQTKDIELDVRMIDKPDSPVPVLLRFGEEKKVGVGKKLDVRAYKIKDPETVGVLLKAETFPIGDEEFFSIRPCDFEDGTCTSCLSEGSIVYSGAGGANVFEGAGLKSLFVEKIGSGEVRLQIRMVKNPAESLNVELKFGETAEIGAGKKIKLKAAKGEEPKTVAMTITSLDPVDSGTAAKENILRKW